MTWFKPPASVLGPYGRALEKYVSAQHEINPSAISFNTDGPHEIMLSCSLKVAEDKEYFLILSHDAAAGSWAVQRCGRREGGEELPPDEHDEEMREEIILGVQPFASYLVSGLVSYANATVNTDRALDEEALDKARSDIVMGVARMGDRYPLRMVASLCAVMGRAISDFISREGMPYPPSTMSADLSALASLNSVTGLAAQNMPAPSIPAQATLFCVSVISVAAELAGTSNVKGHENA